MCFIKGRAKEAARLPVRWKLRCIEIEIMGSDGENKKAHCIEVHDLVCSKLARFEGKDRDFAEIVLRYGLIDPHRLMMRIDNLKDPKVIPEILKKMRAWCERAIEEFDRPEEDHIGPPYGQRHTGEGYSSKFPKDPKIDGEIYGMEMEEGKRYSLYFQSDAALMVSSKPILAVAKLASVITVFVASYRSTALMRSCWTRSAWIRISSS